MEKTNTPQTRPSRSIKVGGKTYTSINKAALATGISWHRLSAAASKGQGAVDELYAARKGKKPSGTTHHRRAKPTLIAQDVADEKVDPKALNVACDKVINDTLIEADVMVKIGKHMVSGKPGMGKSAAALQVGANLGIPEDRTLVVHVNNHDVSLEHTTDVLRDQLDKAEARVEALETTIRVLSAMLATK